MVVLLHPIYVRVGTARTLTHYNHRLSLVITKLNYISTKVVHFIVTQGYELFLRLSGTLDYLIFVDLLWYCACYLVSVDLLLYSVHAAKQMMLQYT